MTGTPKELSLMAEEKLDAGLRSLDHCTYMDHLNRPFF